MREVEGSTPTEQNSAPISVFTEEIVVIVFLGLKFSLLLTRLPNFSAISTLLWDPRAREKTCALIGYQRVQNVFSFDSLVDSP